MFESKLYFFKEFKLNSKKFKKINFVCRQRDFYNKRTIGIWWKKNLGILKIGKDNEPAKQFKYFMFGFSFVDIKCWFEISYIGKRESESKNQLATKGEDASFNINTKK